MDNDAPYRGLSVMSVMCKRNIYEWGCFLFIGVMLFIILSGIFHNNRLVSYFRIFFCNDRRLVFCQLLYA